MTSNSILFNRLRVSGNETCDYRLNQGFNVFKGSNSTGKTSLVWFFDYILGGKTRTDEFPKVIRDNCDTIYADIQLNGETLTLKRSLQKPQIITVYQGVAEHFKDLDGHAFTEYGLAKSNQRKSINDFYLDQLGITPWEVPKSESGTGFFSWRDLVSFVYIPQDRWASFSIPRDSQPLVRKTVFEVFMGINNRILSDQAVKIQKLKVSKTELDTKLNALNQLVTTLDRDIGSEEHIAELNQQIAELDEKKRNIQQMLELKIETNALLSAKESLEKDIANYNSKKADLSNRLEQLEMLNSENELNLERNRLLLKARKLFSELPINKCPKCFNEVKIDDENDVCSICGQPYQPKDAEKEYAQNLFLLMDDKKELTNLIISIHMDIELISASSQKAATTLAEFNQKINNINKDITSPVVKETEAINTIINKLNRSLGEAEHSRLLLLEETKITNQIKRIKDEIAILEKAVHENSKVGSSDTATKAKFLSILTRIYTDVLQLEDKLTGLDELYLPVFENQNRSQRGDIGSSKTVKKILGYYTAVLEFGLQYDSLHPKLLLFDTPRQEELDFPIFTNIIDYWENLRKYNKPYQIIVTGSEFPINTNIIAEFYKPLTPNDPKPARYSVMKASA